MRHRIPDDKKKEKMTLTIDGKISELLDKYLTDKEISNKSKYIESLIRKDMESKDENIERDF